MEVVVENTSVAYECMLDYLRERERERDDVSLHVGWDEGLYTLI